MLIYGNTPKDIGQMMWRRRYKFLSAIAVIGLLICLAGCGTAKKEKIELIRGLTATLALLGIGHHRGINYCYHHQRKGDCES